MQICNRGQLATGIADKSSRTEELLQEWHKPFVFVGLFRACGTFTAGSALQTPNRPPPSTLHPNTISARC